VPVINSVTTEARRAPKPPLTQPFHVAVDRQLKSGHETYEAAELAALKIKNRYPQLHVTVFDAKEHRHKAIERSKASGASNKNGLAPRNAITRGRTAAQ
jgi:hypothetical protein